MSIASDNQDYDFGPFEDDYRGFEPRDGEGKRGPLILALAGGLLLIFIAVIWNTYKQGIRSDARALPIIYADAEPYKRAPENPGGTVAPDQDRVVYALLGDDEDQPLLALAEPEQVQPELRGGKPLNLREGEETDLSAGSSAPLQSSAEGIVSARAAQTAPEPTLELPSSKFAFQSTGGYLVQIAALRTQAAADTAWVKAVGANPAIYNGAEKRVQRADLGAKGVFYRLRVGAFGERPDAVSFCDELKTRGETCIVVSG